MELIYSPDESAYYWQIESGHWATSQLFDTATEAEEARALGKLIWS